MTAAPGETRHVVIVGGGITGLAAAWYLQEDASARSLQIDYTLLESASRFGGKVLTDEVHGYGDEPFVVEGGPDSFITQKPWAMQLAQELGIGDALLGTNDDQRKVFVLNKGRPTPLPDGVLLIVPTKFMPFALSPLISPLGKLRMGMDLFIAPKNDDEDETLADFIMRRLGSEALDKIAEPLMSGIYNAEADRQSVMATFPRFRAIEKQHGSLIRGMLASRKARTSAASPQENRSTNGKPSSIFVSLREGTYQLAAMLHAKLTGDVRSGAQVTGIRKSNGRYHVTFETPDGPDSIDADAVILTTPAYVSGQLVQEIAPAAADALAQVRYVSTGTISLAYRDEDLVDTVDGFGLVIPMSAQRPINAITFSSTKFDHRAPAGHRLLRVFFGGSRSPESMKLDDNELVKVVQLQLRELLGIRAEPLFHRIYRWQNANPQYDIGHLDRVDSIERALPPGLLVTGSAFRGVGIPDCVHQAQLTVETLMKHLSVEPAQTGRLHTDIVAGETL